MGNEDSIYETEWPEYIEALTIDDEVMIAVQINGKLRGTVVIPRDASLEIAKGEALKDEGVAAYLEGKTIIKEIYVAGKIFNLVIR